MKINFILPAVVFICWYSNARAQNSLQDIFTFNSSFVRQVISRILAPSLGNPRNLRLADELHILQPRINGDVPFPCALNDTRSKKRPKSVHALRPGDIDVVAAIGDSLVAGNGLLATNVLQIYIQNRGISAFIGGQANWRKYLTLPNILKEYNPSLTGYSFKDTITNQSDSQLNAADASIKSKDAPSLAKKLIERMRKFSINIKNDWKMITLMIGGNDFCDEMCKQNDPESIIEKHREDLAETLRILRDNLPRTIVNVVLTPHLSLITRTTRSNRPLICYFTQPYLCPCLFNFEFQSQRKQYDEIMLKWQNVESEVAQAAEFDRDDFTVVVQPFLRNYSFAKTRDGLTDYSVLSQDCFHISQKEGARAAISLWNNLLEPVGGKSTSPSELYHFKCPSLDHPYIFTRRNSVNKV